MPIKQAKIITTNSKLYLAFSAIVAVHGFVTASVTSLAFAMWMIQLANYFKTQKTHDEDADCEDGTILGECDVHHTH